ncbi:MAG: hypothetical protein COY38_04785 [Candidatus Aenigmarchaeota archaeon CG_4_10_14_0_8_um_filter_37_24]|nr:NUDIX domain-containing protein [Candidatus Aenigmarchaeota archaeon]OIN86720.1 MAG: hypothetical protein AUJ50_03430 [Candidatus Aenigmarchaeota archaeon CG1_02_38_14]PIV68616.1 MAG: hypothetical protein COS07_03500 [Candidatus Aenigmarchaeota archaeon CG01_land_8_20_14_3_00_37_9]PIW40766.1 MAG: hypothetical protein COW21_05500 [Candidatus Aenigmarchaeota archaeon CG15_BIG_FIL_POST_REV_8_21_14_020_37_27]PIX50748.1 MAG: hypothetical protein COZ52_02535 [Candidatus Aenigmarchaeota archaeon CG
MGDSKPVSYSAGGIVVNKKGEICLVRDKNLDLNDWFIPKGQKENGETSIETAKREIWEETGLGGLNLVKKLGKIRRPNMENPEELKIIDIFLFRASEERIEPQEDCTKAEWFEISEAENNLCSKDEREFFQKHKDEIINAVDVK